MDLWSVPLQVRPLHAERIGCLFRTDLNGHEHREVLRHRPPDESPVLVYRQPSQKSHQRHLGVELHLGHAHALDSGERFVVQLFINHVPC